MTDAIDFSFARPSVDEVAGHGLDILVYTGAARPDKAYLDAMRAAGVAVTLIQESDPNRSQQGYGAGVTDAQYADARADEVGYPTTCAIAYAVSDGSAGDPNYGAGNIAEYARGVKDTSRRPFFWYGNEYACTAAVAGGGGLGTWIPSTWGSGSLLSQEPNIASPVADSDFNTVHAPYGAWGAEPIQEDDDVKPVYISKKSDPNLGIWVSDGMSKRHVLPDEWALVQYLGGGNTQVTGLSDQGWDSIPTAGAGGASAESGGPRRISGTFTGTSA